jgi:hypothetical protein
MLDNLAVEDTLINANEFTKRFISTQAKYRVYDEHRHDKIRGMTIEELYLEYLRRFAIYHQDVTEEQVPGVNENLPIAFRTPN